MKSAAARRVFGLIGDPVAHSLSPDMHNAAFRQMGFPADYRAVRVPANAPQRVEVEMRRLAAGGGGNVTLPHKLTAARSLDVSTAAVRLTGACNCFWLDGSDRLCGDNTDVGGIRSVVQAMAGFEPDGSSVLILGAGGAAAGAVVAALMAGASRVSVRNRTARSALDLVARFPSEPVEVFGLASSPADFDLVIQATSLGLRPDDPLPIPDSESLPPFALDLVYRPGGTRWAAHARDLGVHVEDGLRVLLEQGVLSQERWLGAPVPAAVRDAMQRALADAGS